MAKVAIIMVCLSVCFSAQAQNKLEDEIYRVQVGTALVLNTCMRRYVPPRKDIYFLAGMVNWANTRSIKLILDYPQQAALVAKDYDFYSRDLGEAKCREMYIRFRAESDVKQLSEKK